MIPDLIQIQYCFDGIFNVISFSLLLYSHIPTGVIALFFGIFLLFKSRKETNVYLFALCATFSLWCFLDLSTWFSFMGAPNTMFTWSLIDLTGLLFFFFSYRFLYLFAYENEVPVWQTIVGLLLLLPTIITTLLGLNLVGFDTNVCEAIEQDLVVLYPYLVQLLFIVGCITIGIHSYIHTQEKIHRAKIALATVGVLIFLLFFFTATFIVTLLINYTPLQEAYNFTIYGLFGMPILLLFLGYLIVKYQAFNVKLIGAQAIVTILLLLDISQTLFSSSRSEFVINVLTVILVGVFGFFLIRSVKQEIIAREHNETLAKELAVTNGRLRELDRQKSEFVSIASHQLRSPLTAIRGYASMITEGTYGKIPQKALDIIERIQESSAFMATSIEDFLNVSRIEQGRMRYECALTNIAEMTEKIVEELRGVAMKKGLVLLFRSKCENDAIANVDPGKMRQIIYNIIDNSIKYTEKGSSTITISDTLTPGKISITIADTGIGLSEETRERLFEKFVRAKNANAVNVNGTGLGLFVARKMLEEMHGTISVTSPGEGKGSTFTIEIPLKSI